MAEFVVFSDIVEPNGRTIRENNLERQHAIPLGALVEVDIPGSPHHGLRLRVVFYGRDCDGSPLYSLGFDLRPWPESSPGYLAPRLHGFSDDALLVIDATPPAKDE